MRAEWQPDASASSRQARRSTLHHPAAFNASRQSSGNPEGGLNWGTPASSTPMAVQVEQTSIARRPAS